MQFSSLTRKGCKCSPDCKYMPTISYEGFYMPHAPKEVIDRYEAKQKRKTAAKNATSKLASVVANEDGNREMVAKFKSKSELLKQADKIFGDSIKKRDTVKVFDTEQEDYVDAVKCPCCGNFIYLDAKLPDGKPVVNVLHFVSRGVYDLRFDGDNAHAGDCYCNLAMHLNPIGKEYQNYRKFLVDKFGEPAVAEMELAKRKINRIEESQLKVIIEHYSTVKQ